MDRCFPKRALTVVSTEQGFDLVLRDEALPGGHATVATIPPGVPASYAHCLAASFLMAHALDDVADCVQPDGWGDETLGIEQANIWRAVLRCLLIAQGCAVPPMLHDTELPDQPG